MPSVTLKRKRSAKHLKRVYERGSGKHDQEDIAFDSIWEQHGFGDEEEEEEVKVEKQKKQLKKLAKKSAPNLPQEIIAFTNADKEWHEEWKKGRDWLNIPHPFRAVMSGPPNRGKTTVVKNIIVRQWPPFQKMVIIYPDGQEGTSEYDNFEGPEVTILNDIPPTEYWPPVKKGAPKTCVVIDDFELKGLNKTQRAHLDRLVGHVSTHRNVSVFLLSQNFYNIPPIARRCANLYVLWKPRDVLSMSSVSDRLGVDLRELFTLAEGQHDSIWIDLTKNSPAELRLNGYTKIEDRGLGAGVKKPKMSVDDEVDSDEGEEG